MLDLSSNLAGPLACMIFGDQGADVVKVERPGVGDDTRHNPPYWSGESTVFLAVNRNKRSLTIDLTTEAGLDAFLRLADTADVIVEGFRPGTAARLGIDYETLSARNPRLIYCSVSAFGEGPAAKGLAGYDALVQAFTGMMSMTGHPDRPPARAAASVVDLSTGMWAAMAIMAALVRRGSTGQGELLDAALVDSGFGLLCHQVIGFLGAGDVPGRLGSAAPSTAPYEVFAAADGWIMIAAGNDSLFRRLCDEIGAPELATDARFRTITDRVAHRHQLHDELERHLKTETVRGWLPRLRTAGVAAGPVHDLDQALSDPITAERGLLVDPDGPAWPPDLKLLRLPLHSSRRPHLQSPPRLGEHTVEVLRETGFTDDEIARLVDATEAATANPGMA